MRKLENGNRKMGDFVWRFAEAAQNCRRSIENPLRPEKREQSLPEVVGLPYSILLLAFIVGEALVGPVGFEARGKNEDAELGEAEIVKGSEGGTEVRAVIERAAAAIDNEIGGAGESRGPGFDLGEAVGAAARAVVLSAFDVAGGVEALKADEENEGRGFGIREFLVQLGGLDGLRVGPGNGGVLRDKW